MIVEKSVVSSVVIFPLQCNPCGKSLMLTRSRTGPKTELCGKPALTRDYFDD